jgi:hypothetical protein
MTDLKRYKHAQRTTEAGAVSAIKLREMMIVEDTKRIVGKTEAGTVIYEGGYSTVYLERYTNLATALTAIGSTNTNLVISRTVTLIADTTIPENVILDFKKGGIIALAGFTLTINSPIYFPKFQIFSGSGTVNGSGKATNVTPYAWGAVGNGSTNDYSACQKALSYVGRFVNGQINGDTLEIDSIFATETQLEVSNFGVHIQGTRFINPDGTNAYNASVGFKYTGTLDATKAVLKVNKTTEEINTKCFSIDNIFFHSNDLCGFGLYCEGSGRGAISETTYNNRGISMRNLSFVGYIKAGFVLGSYVDGDLEDPNAAQFENLSIENLRFNGGSLIDDTNFTDISGLESIGFFVNAGNLEFGVCNNLYFDPPTTRAHKHHVWQRLGGLIINGIVSTRAGSAGVVYGRSASADEISNTNYIGNLPSSTDIPWAIVSYDQLIINGWRMEDRWAFKQAGTTFNAPSEIRNVVQRPDAGDPQVSGDYGLFTLATDNVWDCPGYDSSIKLINVTTNASVAIGSSAKSIGEADIIFSRPGGTLTVSGSKQYGKYVDAYKGDYKFMGKQPRINLTDENNVTVFESDRGSTYFPRFNPYELDQLWIPFDGGQSQSSTVTFTSGATQTGKLLGDYTGTYATNDKVRFTNSGGALPTGLAVDTDYYIFVDDDEDAVSTSFYIATSRANLKAGTYIAYTNAGTGTHTVHRSFIPSASTEIVGVDTGARGTLLGLTATVAGAYLTAGKEMPATGFLHLENVQVPFGADEALTGINASTNGASQNLINRWIPYVSGTGNVPASDTLITGNTSASTGYLVEVCATLGGSATAPGAPMPASGYIHLKYSGAIFNASEALTGIGATTSGTGTLLLDNYDIGHGTFIRLNPDSTTKISGIESTRTGRFLLLSNVSSFVITLTNNGSRSSSGNKFTTHSGTDLVLNTNDVCMVIWDVSSNVWRALKIADPYTVDFLDGSGAGKIYSTLISGFVAQALTGSSFDFNLRAVSGTSVMNILTGKDYVSFPRRVEMSKGANLTAANDLVLTAEGNKFVVTGNTQINGMTSTGVQSGTDIVLQFSGTPTVKHNTAMANTFTASSSSGLLLTYTDDFQTLEKVRFTTTTTLPTGLSLATDYWIVRVSGTTSRVATSLANAIAGTYIPYTDAGTGTHTMTKQAGMFKLQGSADLVCASDTVLHVWFDGTYWQEISRKTA